MALCSVQYFGSWTPQRVKDRVTEVLYGWTLWLKDEAKIQEAYRMLKKQGLMLQNHEGNSVCIRAPVNLVEIKVCTRYKYYKHATNKKIKLEVKETGHIHDNKQKLAV